jgi:thiol-disulfide isomerase/thioredoxin
MNRRQTFLFIVLLSFLSLSGKAQGIEFFKGSWKEALEMSKSTGQLIFVDANTSWCGPCKRMAAQVFTQKKVGDFYNGRFINMKIDMEKGDVDFRSNYSVSGYPTLLFLDSTGAIVKRKMGGQRAKGLIQLGKDALAIYDNVDEMTDIFEKGKRDAAFLRKYVKALNNAGKPSAKAVNIFIRSQKDMSTKENLQFIFNAVSAADSKVFDLLIKHRSAIEALHSKKAVNSLIEKACQKTVETAIEFQDKTLLAEAKDKMKKHHSDGAKKFKYQADLQFYAATHDVANYLKCAKKYSKKIIKKDASQQHQLAADVAQSFPKDSKAVEFAERLAQKAAETGGLWQYYLTYAQLLARNNKKEEAIKMAEKAKNLAQANKESSYPIMQFLSQLKRAK